MTGSLLFDLVVDEARRLTSYHSQSHKIPPVSAVNHPLHLQNPSIAPASHGKVSVLGVPLLSGEPYSHGWPFPTPQVESQCQSCLVIRIKYRRSFPQQGPKHLDCSTRGFPFIVRTRFPYTVHPDPSSPLASRKDSGRAFSAVVPGSWFDRLCDPALDSHPSSLRPSSPCLCSPFPSGNSCPFRGGSRPCTTHTPIVPLCRPCSWIGLPHLSHPIGIRGSVPLVMLPQNMTNLHSCIDPSPSPSHAFLSRVSPFPLVDLDRFLSSLSVAVSSGPVSSIASPVKNLGLAG